MIRQHRAIWPIFIIGTVTLALESAWLYLSLPFLDKITGGSTWISFDMIPQELAAFSAKILSGNLLLGSLLLYALWRHGRGLFRSPADRMLITIVILGIALPIAASLHSPIIVARFLIVYLPALFFVAAGLLCQVLDRLPDNRRMWVAPVFGIGLASAVLMQKINIKADWEGTGDIVRSFVTCAGMDVVAYPSIKAFKFPATDPEEQMFLHSYAAAELPAKLVPLTKANLLAVRENPCPVLVWITRLEPYYADRMLARHGVTLSELDHYKSTKALIVFKPSADTSSLQ